MSVQEDCRNVPTRSSACVLAPGSDQFNHSRALSFPSLAPRSSRGVVGLDFALAETPISAGNICARIMLVGYCLMRWTICRGVGPRESEVLMYQNRPLRIEHAKRTRQTNAPNDKRATTTTVPRAANFSVATTSPTHTRFNSGSYEQRSSGVS